MSETITDFDKEVIRTRSAIKDFLSFFFAEYVLPQTIKVPIPLIGNHRLDYSEKKNIERFMIQSVDAAEPLDLLVMAKKGELIFAHRRGR